MNDQQRSQKKGNDSKKWDSKSLAPEFFHRLFYGAIKIAGRHTAYFMLFFVVSFYCLLPGVRGRAKPYLQKRFPGCGGFKLFLNTFRLYWNFGCMLVDRSVFRILGRFEGYGSSGDKELLRSLHRKHGRLILLAAHAGCWQMGLSFLDFIHAPKAVVMLMEKGNVDSHAFKINNPSKGRDETAAEEITIINPAAPMGGTIEMLSALNHGSILCINADRTFGSDKHVVDADLLGGKIQLPISAYKLAASSGAPIAVVFSARTGAGKGKFWVAEVIHIPADADKGRIRGAEAFAPYARRFAEQLEKYSYEHPWQFYNFFDMWN